MTLEELLENEKLKRTSNPIGKEYETEDEKINIFIYGGDDITIRCDGQYIFNKVGVIPCFLDLKEEGIEDQILSFL